MSARQPPPSQLAAPAAAELSPVSGPDMQQLHRRYPPRAAEPSWRVTRQDGGLLLARMLELPFTSKDQRVRRRGAGVGDRVAGRSSGPDVAATLAGHRR